MGNISLNPVFIGATPGPGDSISFYPGKGSKGYADGSIIFNDADQKELIAINGDRTVSILGETFSLEDIRDALKDFVSDKCKCPVKQLMALGCQCGRD